MTAAQHHIKTLAESAAKTSYLAKLIFKFTIHKAITPITSETTFVRNGEEYVRKDTITSRGLNLRSVFTILPDSTDPLEQYVTSKLEELQEKCSTFLSDALTYAIYCTISGKDHYNNVVQIN